MDTDRRKPWHLWKFLPVFISVYLCPIFLSLARAQGVLLEDEGIEIFQPPSTPEHPRPLGLRMAAPKGEPKKPE
jgi:hypothetical protein